MARGGCVLAFLERLLLFARGEVERNGTCTLATYLGGASGFFSLLHASDKSVNIPIGIYIP